MRIKVRIDVTLTLKKEWRVSTNDGNYAIIFFKYEKLGVFYYMCGIPSHTDKVCPNLFELDSDDGAFEWGIDM